MPWALRATDVDLHGHVNNAVYWQAVEELFGDALDGRVQAELDYRQPIDLGEEIDLARFGDAVAFVAGDAVRAVARFISGKTTG